MTSEDADMLVRYRNAASANRILNPLMNVVVDSRLSGSQDLRGSAYRAASQNPGRLHSSSNRARTLSQLRGWRSAITQAASMLARTLAAMVMAAGSALRLVSTSANPSDFT